MGLLDYQTEELHEEISEIGGVVAEMGPLDASVIEIPVDPKVIEKIKTKDSDAQFVVMEVESGVSKSNRRWSPEMVERIVKRVNDLKPVGYQGHIPEKDDAYAFPDPQTLWIGASSKRVGDKVKAYFKGYLFTKKIRDMIDLGMVNAISIRGDTTLRPTKGGILDVVDFTLESIDWARKGRNGMPSRVVSIASEMEDTVDGKDIALISESELRQYAPHLVTIIENKAKGDVEAKVGEMQSNIAALEPQAELLGKVREIFSLGENDDPMDSIAELQESVNKASRASVKAYISDAIKNKVKTERGQKLVQRIVGEMEDVKTLDEESKKEIDKRLETAFESDEDVKAVVGEMTGEPAGETGGAGLGGRRRQERAEDENNTGRTGKISRSTRKVGR